MHVTILIADDERSIVDSLAEIMESAGYQVLSAYSGTDAIVKARQHCPAVLLSDVLMPGMNGFELALKIKEICPNSRLLLFSGQAATAQLAQKFSRTFTRLGYRFELLPKPPASGSALGESRRIPGALTVARENPARDTTVLPGRASLVLVVPLNAIKPSYHPPGAPSKASTTSPAIRQSSGEEKWNQ